MFPDWGGLKGAGSQRDRDTERHRTEINRRREAGGERDRWSQRRGRILEILISLESGERLASLSLGALSQNWYVFIAALSSLVQWFISTSLLARDYLSPLYR